MIEATYEDRRTGRTLSVRLAFQHPFLIIHRENGGELDRWNWRDVAPGGGKIVRLTDPDGYRVEVVRTLGHELRNPLFSMSANLELLVPEAALGNFQRAMGEFNTNVSEPRILGCEVPVKAIPEPVMRPIKSALNWRKLSLITHAFGIFPDRILVNQIAVLSMSVDSNKAELDQFGFRHGQAPIPNETGTAMGGVKGINIAPTALLAAFAASSKVSCDRWA